MAHCTDDDALLAALARLPEHFARRSIATGCRSPARSPQGQSLFVLGRGPSLAIANEAALKFKETCGMHAEAYSAAEVMHGPLALVGPGFPVLALAARDASEAFHRRSRRRAGRQGRVGLRDQRCRRQGARCRSRPPAIR